MLATPRGDPGTGTVSTSRPGFGHPPAADRILIVRLGALGDVVRTLPAVHALRALYPGAHLTWLVEPASAGVVESAGFIDETFVFPRRDLVGFLRAADGLSLLRSLAGVVGRLRRRRFDLALDFHGILKSGVLTRLSGAPRRVGFDRSTAREFADLFVNQRVRLPGVRISRYERNAALVRSLCATFEPEIPVLPMLQPSALAVARLTARLRVSKRQGIRGFILIHPGSSAGARHKRYSPLAWAEVIRELASQGDPVWLVAGPNRHERHLVDEILRMTGDAAVAAPETRSFDDLLALVVRAGVFVSSDSGPLHGASLAGVPVVQLIGPTDPIQNAPWRGSRHVQIRIPLPCSPCRRGCEDAACMRAIPPRRVVEEIRALRDGGSPGGLRSAKSP